MPALKQHVLVCFSSKDQNPQPVPMKDIIDGTTTEYKVSYLFSDNASIAAFVANRVTDWLLSDNFPAYRELLKDMGAEERRRFGKLLDRLEKDISLQFLSEEFA